MDKREFIGGLALLVASLFAVAIIATEIDQHRSDNIYHDADQLPCTLVIEEPEHGPDLEIGNR